MKTLRKIIAFPFVLVGVILYAIGASLQFGFEDALGILQDLRDSVLFTKQIRGNK